MFHKNASTFFKCSRKILIFKIKYDIVKEDGYTKIIRNQNKKEKFLKRTSYNFEYFLIIAFFN